jgi:hypothetical protein
MVNHYIAHTANHLRRPNIANWNLQVDHLTKAQRAICKVALTFDHDVLGGNNYVKIIPIPQFDIMQEFRPWVPDTTIKTLWDCWHAHNDAVNAWISG